MNHCGGSIKNDLEYQSIKESEGVPINPIEEAMSLFESTRLKDPELFAYIITKNKEIMEILALPEINNRDDIRLLSVLFNDIEKYDERYLFWCMNKGIRLAAIENKNIDIVNFLVIRKNLKLDKAIHKSFLVEYFNSLSDVNFIDCNQEDMNRYVAILDILINYACADINEPHWEISNTPLHVAVVNKQYQFILILLKKENLNLSPINKHGDTPLDQVMESLMSGKDKIVNEEIFNLLLRFNAEANTLKHMLCKKEKEDEGEGDIHEDENK